MTLDFKKKSALLGKWKLLSRHTDIEILIQFLDKNTILSYNAIYSESKFFSEHLIKKCVVPFKVDLSENGKILRFRYQNRDIIEIFKIAHLDLNLLLLIELKTNSKFELIRTE